MEYRQRPSPHQSPRGGKTITAIVLHDTAGESAESALRWFEDPRSRVSAHLVIDRDGTITQCVPFDRRAWHAGAGVLHGEGDVNGYSIGIELVDRSDDPYPEAQLARLAEVTAELVRTYRIPLNRIVGHQHIAMPAGRKVDPGRDFPWYDFLLSVGRLV